MIGMPTLCPILRSRISSDEKDTQEGRQRVLIRQNFSFSGGNVDHKKYFPLTRNGGRELIESGSSFTVSINNSPFFSPPLPARFEKRLPQAGKESQLSMNTNQKKRKGVRPNANFATICSPDRGCTKKWMKMPTRLPERGKHSTTSVCCYQGGEEGNT